MLEVLNRYAHGMVLLPFVDAMRRQGCLAHMASSGRFSTTSLCGRFSLNEGYVAVALRMFRTLGWIEAAGEDHWCVTGAFDAQAAIPDRIMELYRFPFDGYARGSAKRSLRRWLERSADGWATDDERLRDYLDGVFAIPLLLALEQHECVRRGTADAQGRMALDLDLAEGPRREIETWLLSKHWIRRDAEGLCLLPSGQSMLERIRTTAALASYRPMFAQTATLLGGVPDDVFALDGKGHEKHLDRTLNVVGSGFQHQRYFAALAGFVLRCFDTDDVAAQPTCLADTGCGDGTLLRTLYDKVLAETTRGAAIDRHPLRLAAIDWNVKALRQSALTLAGTPHTAIKGDIGDPAGIVADLDDLGIGTPDDVLHVRSFLDHDRPYRPPVDAGEAAARRVVGVDGVFVDHAGGRIPARDVMQSTVEHLRRWGEVVGGDGLLLLEVHSLPTAIGAAFIDEAESLHFDAYHSMSRQFLLDARSFVLAAAEAGLFCADGEWQSYPQRMGFTRITVNHFRRRPHTVRHLHLGEDLDRSAATPVWQAVNDAPAPATLADTTLVLVRDGRIRAALAWREDEPAVATPGRRAHLQGGWLMSGEGGRGDDLAALLVFAGHYLLVDKSFESLEGVDACRAALDAWCDAPHDGWADTLAAVRAAAARRADEPGLDSREWEAELTDFALRRVVAWLHGDAGLARGDSRRKADVIANLGVLSKYHRYLDALLSRLDARGLLRSEGDTIALTASARNAGIDDVDDFARDFLARHPHASAYLHFILGPLRHFADVLAGRVAAASAMFPDGDMQAFGGIFHGEPIADYINELIAAAVGARHAARAGAPLRILEIGAGTGGTTISVLRALGASADVSYVFSDLSPAFLRRAQRALADRYPYVGFHVLDIEGDLATQDVAAGTYDVVIAANVLHNTRDIAFTLRQVRELLAPGGTLLLAEYTEAKTWLLFSGGLLHGTWQFEDGAKRLDDFCLLGVPQWRHELAEAGFVAVSAFGLPSAPSVDASGHTIFACRAPDTASRRPAPLAPACAANPVPDHEDTQSMASPEPDPAAVDPAFASLVRDQVMDILGERRAAAFDANRPLMQLGLDSVELVELKGAIGRAIGVKLAPAFLFENETAAKVAAALADMAPNPRPVEASAAPVQAPLPGEERAIAVIGIACRLPGANTTEAFWHLLRDGRHAIASLDGRWRWPDGVDLDGEHAGIDRAGLLDRIDAFDADFFHISPHEAERLDPQQRLLLELGWEAMERSGYRPSQLAARRTGVFVGACHSDYRDLLARAPGAGDAYIGTGSAPSMLANRLSYVYDFNGPSVCIDTACSSALVAMDRAVQSLRGDECDIALLGAVNLLCSPVNSVAYHESGMLSRTGRVRAFDEAANGFVRGEGAVVLLLKPLRHAMADGDIIHGIVLGTAVGHGGRAASLTAPKPASQAAVIEQAMRDAGVRADDLQYVEAHGTGTPLGDVVEIAGLRDALNRRPGEVASTCAIGSVKTNIGHLEGAAGLAGVVKVLLSMGRGTLPASLGFETANPGLGLGDGPLRVVEATSPWPRRVRADGREAPRVAGVSSFGFGGVNAHAILAEPPIPAHHETARIAPSHHLVLSARNEAQLRGRVAALRADLDRIDDDARLADVAWTLQHGREPMERRLVVTATSLADARRRLDAVLADDDAMAASTEVSHGDALMGRWLAGEEVDWNTHPDASPGRRIELSGYPFARTRHWIDDGAAATHPVPVLSHAHWTRAPVDARAEADERHVLLLQGMDDSAPFAQVAAAFQGRDGIACDRWVAETHDPGEAFEGFGWRLLAYLKRLLVSSPRSEILVQVAFAGSPDTLLSGLGGLLKTAQRENPRIGVQLIQGEANDDAPSWVAAIDTGSRMAAVELRRIGGVLEARRSSVLDGVVARMPWRPEGVYLVTGGAGGLGLAFVEELFVRAPAAHVVLAGRSPLRGDAAARVAAWQRSGRSVAYRQVDVARRDETIALVRDIEGAHGVLHGVLHAAGVIRDSYLLRKTPEEYAQVMAPKLHGALNLDAAIGARPLDFFVLFSSVAGTDGNPGQGDYAAANAAMDAFARQRARRVAEGDLHGQTLSIAWPWWSVGGMRIPEATAEELRSLGVSPLDTDDGIAAFYLALGSRAATVAIAAPCTASFVAPAPVATGPKPPVPAMDAPALAENLTQRLKHLLAEVSGQSPARIDPIAPLERYGIDSMMVLQLNKRLGAVFERLSKTVLYEHATLRSLRDHLLSRYPEACSRWCQVAPVTPATPVAGPAPSVGATPAARAAAREPIAVIGMAGRYPGARDLRTFWTNLSEGRDCIGEIPPERWSLEGFYDPDELQASARGRSYGKWGGFIEGFSEFDALFFGIAPRDADMMDPQERLFLQTCWEAVEDAGYTRESLDTRHHRSVGVFAGVTKTGFDLYGPALWRRGEALTLHTSFASIANRVSYVMNLQGPSMPVDTMCSASLTAVHEACEHLLRDECELALAGGVNLYLHPSSYVYMCATRMLSPGGRCRTFGAGADGMVPGEGSGAVLLKRLSTAIADRDPIHGVILGTSINHGGRTHGYTVPNPLAQRDLVSAALDRAGIDARSIGYIEAHGTGTELGDPIEIAGLTQAFERSTADRQFCAIGSVKTMIGHAESAAGIAGLTRILLQMKHGALAPSLHAEETNPHIDFAATPFFVQSRLAPWPRQRVEIDGAAYERPRRAGVSSFGAGGANAHVVVEEYVVPAGEPTASTAPRPAIIVLSAKSVAARREVAARLLHAIEADRLDDGDLHDIAHTLQVGREAMSHRLAFVVDSMDALRQRLRAIVDGESVDGVYLGDGTAVPDGLAALVDAADVARLASAWLANGDYRKVCELWVGGLPVDWRVVPENATARRRSLPTYPFERTRFWIAPRALGAAPAVDAPPLPAPMRDGAPGKPTAIALRALSAEATSRTERPTPSPVRPAPPMPVSTAMAAPDTAAAAAPPVHRRDPRAIEAELGRMLGRALYMEAEDIDPRKPFAELGLDSIIGVEWLRAVNAHFHLRLPTAKIYDCPTLAQMAAHVVQVLERQDEPMAVKTPVPTVGDAVREDIASAAAAPPEPPRAADAAVHDDIGRARNVVLEPIAIVGMSGRYPGAEDLNAFWNRLADGVDCVTEVPPERWAADRADVACRWLGVVDDIDAFDPLYFGISPAEAELMDPQHRLFLQEASRAFDDAGCHPGDLGGARCGVYLGIMGNEYAQIIQRHGGTADSTGNSGAIAAARIAYLLDLKGPAIAIDTACSSSLVATHLACQALRHGEVDMALAGGVTLYLAPELYVTMSAAGMLSSDGRCKTMDDGANGFVPGEGVGALVLKRLSDAEAAGDPIHGVILGSGINQDGKTNGITAPSAARQAELQREVYARHGIDPATIGYVEMHGTGTKLGDPIELEALRSVYEAAGVGRQRCVLGSVKSNIGHTSAAAGVAGVHKVLLSLRHGELVPSLHFTTPNEHFDFATSPFRVGTAREAWARIDGAPRRAAVSSFGYSGTNAHLVIEEYVDTRRPAMHERSTRGASSLFVLSARSEERLRVQAARMLDWMEAHEALDVDAFTHTLQVGREAMEHRIACAFDGVDGLRATLRAFVAGERHVEGLHQGEVRRHRETVAAFAADDDLHGAVAAWIAKGKYDTLLDLWVKGLDIDWKALRKDASPRKLSLPAYPFRKQRFWIGGDTPPPVPHDPRPSVRGGDRPVEPASLTTFVPRWEAVSPTATGAAMSVAARVLVFGANDADRRAILERHADARFLDTADCADLATLIETLRDEGVVERVLWIARESMDGHDEEAMLAVQENGLLPCFRVLRALADLGYGSRRLDLTVVTWRTQRVIADEPVHPGHAGLHGLMGSVAKEYLLWKIRCADLDDEGDLPLVELAQLPDGADVHARRRGEWFRRRLVAFDGGVSERTAYRDGGVYVIVGGAGGLGEVFSEHLVRHHRARVVWIGRRAEDDDIAARIRRLGAVGPAPLYIRADARDRAAMEAARAQVIERYGVIHGVVHSAIVLLDQGIAGMDETRFRAALSAKTDVCVRLAQVFAADELDFVLFFSSLQSFARLPGQGNYAAGSAFEDAFADRLGQRGAQRVKVVNWGYWGTVGCVALAEYAERFARQGTVSIDPVDAMRALDGVMAGTPFQVAITGPLGLEHGQAGYIDASDVIEVAPPAGMRGAMSFGEQAPSPFHDVSEGLVDGLDRHLLAVLFAQLRAMGLFGAEATTLDACRRQAGIVLRHDAWFDETVALLCRHGLLAWRDDRLCVGEQAPAGDPWPAWHAHAAWWRAVPVLRGQVTLLEAMLHALPAILRGERAATEVMFADGMEGVVETIYRDHALADHANGAMAAALDAYVERRVAEDPAARIRVLEIGAGTGGSSGAMLASLERHAANVVEYAFTDLSAGFLLRARDRFAGRYPFLVARPLDITREPGAQGFDHGGYDVVVAANVLHATADIRRTMRHVKALLRGHGLLLLQEMSANSPTSHLTFGLLDGWWLVTDPALRLAGCPALSFDGWSRVLAEAGFDTPTLLTSTGHPYAQQVVAAHGDGLLRRPRAIVEAPLPSASAPAPASVPVAASALPPAGDPLVRVRDTVAACVCGVLRLPAAELDPDIALVHYGMDSISAGHLIQRINVALDLSLATTDLFDHGSVDRLTAYIGQAHGEALRRDAVREPPSAPAVAQPVPATTGAGRDAIAIVGLSARFPGSPDADVLWENLANGRDLVTPVDRWPMPPADAAKGAIQPLREWRGGLLEGVDEFDPFFFNISGIEATYMDPQQRLFLEASWKALEDAGHAGSSVQGSRCGVYVGCNAEDYSRLLDHVEPAQALWGQAVSLLPARISYHLDLQGPAIAVDTACSSSMVAMHMACQGLWGGEIDMALAGGVYVRCTPYFYLASARANLLSPTGRCHTFDDRADGFVPSEGVAAFVLKRQADAVAAGDHIHALIVASAINQDGASNGITAPSGASQQRLLASTYEAFGIHPRQVQMVEAHGTGTKLGDPIEYQALKRTYADAGVPRGHCALGSIKANLGHAIAAAGAAGVMRALLSLRHRRIPPAVNFERPSSHIDLSDGPFYVNTTLRDWPVADGQRRLAAISSFGLSGTNAHMVLAEAPEPVVVDREERSAWLVVLSAKTRAQLVEQARRLSERLSRDPEHIADVAFTLLAGRKHFEHRLACVVAGTGELVDRLDGWLRQSPENEVRSAHVTDKRVRDDVLAEGAAAAARCHAAVGTDAWRPGLVALAAAYLSGYVPDADAAALRGAGRRIPLPTYPFAREHYWVGHADPSLPVAVMAPKVAAHRPMLRGVAPAADGSTFGGRLDGSEVFLRDHVVNGARVMPAVGYVEMLRDGLSRAQAPADRAERFLRLGHVGWSQPLVVGDVPVDVRISLDRRDEGGFSYEVRSLPDGQGGESRLHSRGTVDWVAGEPAASVDPAELDRRCERSLDATACYDAFAARGVDYGPTHRTLRRVGMGRDDAGRPYVLATLEAAPAPHDDEANFFLDPGLMDGALQATIGWSLDDDATGTLLDAGVAWVPYALDRVEVLGPLNGRAYAVLRRSASTQADLPTFDIRLHDADGLERVRIDGCVMRRAGERTVLLAREWRSDAGAVVTTGGGLRHVIVCTGRDDDGERHSRFAAALDALAGCRAEHWDLPSAGMAERCERYAWRLLEAVRALSAESSRQDVLVQVVGGDGELLRGLAGLLKTAHIEHPGLRWQTIEADVADIQVDWIDRLRADAERGVGEIRYTARTREIATWTETVPVAAAALPWREGGVYVITGGMGGLGMAFAEYLGRHVKHAHVVLVGRSELDNERRRRLQAWLASGYAIEYRQADLADEGAAVALVDYVLRRHGALHGVLHGAAVVRDSLLARKTAEDFAAVWRSKVHVGTRLDDAIGGRALDFFIVFSAAAGVWGHLGQADYAAANACMDGFAQARHARVARGERKGRSLAIAWPLWEEGGLRMSAPARERMERQGFRALATAEGIAALERAWATPHAGVAVVRASADWRLAEPAPAGVTPVVDAPVPAGDAPATTLVDTSDIAGKTFDFLARMLAEEVRFPRDRIDATEPFESYGIDSTLVMQMTARLEDSFGALSKTLFFEHQNLGELCDYFLRSHLARLRTLLGVAEAPPPVAPVAPVAAPPAPAPAVAARAAMPTRTATPEQASPRGEGPADIAIVGLGGRYPQADTLEEFWSNLRDGRDAVTEIPATRWDHDRFFDPEVGKPGKSYSKWGGFISGVDEFDPLFFNMSPLEARQTDPQERIFLQCVYQTLEDAGHTRESLRHAGRVGVFVGAMYQEYQLYAAQAQARGEALVVGASLGSIANRVSYFCDFHGPSLSVDTMCSSSLTALHLACQSLRTGDCEVAIAGGVNVSVHPNKYLMLAHAQFASSTGRCTSFAAGGDGYVPAEAVGAVLLRPLAAALADGDQVYGVIKAIEVNHGGRTNAYTVPSPKAQAELIARVIERAGVPAWAISYLEAHGTGTALGDPIEIAGLQQAFSRDADARGVCAIGSVKSNIGHAESAAGIAGLTKVLLQLRHGELVPSLHARTLNPHIDFAGSSFAVQRERADWTRPTRIEAGSVREYPRVAGISSFGAGGSNAHMIVAEHRVDDVARIGDPSWPTPIVVLSARKEDRLRVRVQQLLAMLERTPEEALDLHDVAFTLQVGREPMDHRLAVVAASHATLKEALRRYLDGDRDVEGMHVGAVRHDRLAQSLLSPDEDMQRTTEAWLAKGRYAKLLDLWVLGLAVDWPRLYGATKPRRISLPTYPFGRQRYWPDEPVVSASPMVPPPTTAAMPSPIDDGGALMLAPVWEPLHDASSTSPVFSGRTVVIGSPGEHAAALDAFLGDAERLSPPPGASVEDIARGLRGEARVARVVWFAPARDAADIDDPDDMVRAQESGVVACFRLAKALLAEGYGDGDLDWTVVTWRTQSVFAADEVDPAHAGVQGLVGAIAREYPRWHVRGVDLPRDDADALRALATVPDEVRGATLAWRDGAWHRQRLLPYATRREAPAFRQGGVYVVVGGAGGIGAVLTEHLVRHYQARVWWIGRRAEDDDAIRSKLAALSRLGPAPIYCRADAADANALEGICKRIEAQHPTIHGVVHSAIVLDDASVASMTESSLRAALRAKVDASVRTAEVFLPRCQDFMLFFSSMQSHSRSAGQGNYAAGCAFKDAFAQRLAMRGTAVKLINWGYWGSVGVVAEAGYRDAMAALGIGSIEPLEGMAALEAAMADGARQLAFVRTTRPGALGDLVGDDRIERLPPGLPSLPPAAMDTEAATPVPPADPLTLERSQAVLLGVQLREAGLWKARDERLEYAAIRRWQAEHAWAPYHARWLSRSLDLLARHDVLRAEADGYALPAAAHEEAAVAWAHWHAERQAWRELPSANVQADLVEYTLPGLPDVWSGRRSATDLLFPDGSMSRVAPVYARNAVADHVNAWLVARLGAWIQARREADPDARLRILEIGAGTGGTSGAVLELIDRHAAALEVYDYTDLSGAFLQHGRDHHAANRSYMRFQRFDVERSPSSQGMAVGTYDVVIAANVMHATADVRRAVRHAKALLRRHGLLLLNEIGDAGLFEQLSFGLLEGWWRHADDGLRLSGTPALTAERWTGVLHAEGFTDVHVDAPAGHRQQVICALSDGWLRQPVEGGKASLSAEHVAAPMPTTADSFEDAVANALSRLTGVAAGDIDPDAPLGEYGVDSIVSRRLVQEMERAFPVSLAGGALLEHNSVRKLAAHVAHLVATRNDLAAVPIEEALEHFRGGQLDMDAIEALLDEGMSR